MSSDNSRISELPDEIIPEILVRLRSPKQVVQSSILSKRWTHIFRSYYPILEFADNDFPSLERSAAALKKLLSKPTTAFVEKSAVRIEIKQFSEIYWDHIDRIFDLAAKSLTLEIDIGLDIRPGYHTPYSIPQSVFLPNDDDEKFQRLKVLKLRGCHFDQYKDVSITSPTSLEVLCLENVKFRDFRALTSMIAGAPLLETLTLENVRGKGRLQVVLDHPNLKILNLNSVHIDGVKITYAHSLVELRIIEMNISNVLELFDSSPMPNLKVLRLGIREASTSDAEVIHKIVSELLPSLELLGFPYIYAVEKLAIVNNCKLREIRLDSVSGKIEIDVPSLAKLCYGQRTIRFPEIHETAETEENLALYQHDQRKVEQRAHLLRSCPVLEFDEDYYYGPQESKERFAKAALDKFSPRQGNNISTVEAVRVKIKSCSDFNFDFLDDVLELAARSSSLQEIDVEFPQRSNYWELPYRIPVGFFLPYRIPLGFFLPSPPNKEQFLRLNVLKLTNCNFDRYKCLVLEEDDNPFSSLASSLKVLSLHRIYFPNDTVLNSIIVAASLLETLTLKYISGMQKFRIRNHPNLKEVDVVSLDAEGVEITGAPSLKKVCVADTSMESVQISSTPNLKELYIGGVSRVGDEDINKLIEGLPSLELLRLDEYHTKYLMWTTVTIVSSGGHRKVFIGTK